jgi:hypothetical protein
LPIDEFLLLSFAFELFEESSCEVFSGGVNDNELFIFDDFFIFELSCSFIPSPSPSSLSSSASFLLIKDLFFSFSELFFYSK